MKIEGKTAIVVGAARSQGMGKAFLVHLLEKGAKVVFGDILVERGQTTAAELAEKYGEDRVVFVKCDNTKDEDIEGIFKTALDKYRQVDICIHNSGVFDNFDWKRTMEVNFGGTMRTTLEAVKHMSIQNGGKGGVIVNMSSISALEPMYNLPVYGATKAGVLGFSLAFGAPEMFADTGVCVNAICPSLVDTDLLESFTVNTCYKGEEIIKFIKEGEAMRPEYVAKGVIQLIEDDSITGKAMKVLCGEPYEIVNIASFVKT